MLRTGKITQLPIVRTYTVICPYCGEVFEITDKDTFYNPITKELNCSCPECCDVVEEDDMFLTRVCDNSGKEIIKYIIYKS